MKITLLDERSDVREILKKLRVSPAGIEIMEKKAKLSLILIKDMKTAAANILKQDALSVGAELAVSKDTVLCKKDKTDALLIADLKRLQILSEKELSQPFGLKELAKKIKEFINLPSRPVKIMGVINANEDSFYEGSRFSGENALKKIVSMIKEGADIIDIGGVSSRPGSVYPGEEEEFKRVKPIIDAIYEESLYEKALFSIDSYSPKCVSYALERGFRIVNDITALSNDETAKIAGEFKAKTVLMHMKGTPKDMQKNPFYEDVIKEVEEFFEKRIEKALKFGIKDIILDTGIGFGKRLEDNLKLIKHQKHFLKFGYELLVGASRKSMIDKIHPSEVEERLPGTLAIHLKAVENGASIIRVHDVKEHVQALKVWLAIENTTV